jgi:hypothetical protein
MPTERDRVVAQLEDAKRRKAAYERLLWILLRDAKEFESDKDVLNAIEKLYKVVQNWINMTELSIRKYEDMLHAIEQRDKRD